MSCSDDESEDKQPNFPDMKEMGAFSEEEDVINHINYGNSIIPYSIEAIKAGGVGYNTKEGHMHGLEMHVEALANNDETTHSVDNEKGEPKQSLAIFFGQAIISG